MTKKVILQKKILIEKIMCGGCGSSVNHILTTLFEEFRDKGHLPKDAELCKYPQPDELGIHSLKIKIKSEEALLQEHVETAFFEELTTRLTDANLRIITDLHDTQSEVSGKANWVNILINLLAMGVMIALWFAFPPSLPLTIALTSITFLTTAFTAREYLLNFFRNLRDKNLANMTTTISFGWFLSLAHTLYHSIHMPHVGSFSMAFMSFIMPVMLITIINGMDEIKRVVLNKSKKMQLKGMQTLFPQMENEYDCYALSPSEQSELAHLIQSAVGTEQFLEATHGLFTSEKLTQENTDELKEGMCIVVKHGECFPVDCILINGNTMVDASILSGESQLEKTVLSSIPAGAINLGRTVTVYAQNEAYDSTINRILFRANRAQNKVTRLHLISELPTSPAKYINSYLLIKKEHTQKLYYVKPDGEYEKVKIIDFHLFEKKINAIKKKDEIKLHLDEEQIKEIITSNREPAPATKPTFTYLYTGLIFAGIIASIAAPLALGILTLPLLLQNVMGILFAVCPCTIAIAHQLPHLVSVFHRGNRGIHLRDEELYTHSHNIHTVVFDKTGTLTTGQSTIAHFEGITNSLWERIYLLEKTHGGAHPIAKAITHYWKNKPAPLFAEVKDEILDTKNRGLSANVQGIRIHLGNAEFFKQANIPLPEMEIPPGLSPLFVAENNAYQGVIFIRHEPRKNIEKTLKRLKEQPVNIIMLTGDSESSAKGFNHQIGSVFDEEKNIHAANTPQDKENFLLKLMNETENPEGIWFVGDGLNDAPCARIVSERGGVSCAISPDDKAAFFTDISLNGSFDYLFQHNKLNRFLKKNVLQNQGLLAYSSVAFLAFIISFSIAGIAVSPLIPLVIMLSTTFFILFNSYRVQLSIDSALDENASWPTRFLASDGSIGLLVSASSLLICAVLIATITTGGLALPIVFTAGAALAVSSACAVGGATLFGLFGLLIASHLVVNHCMITSAEEEAVNSTHHLTKKSDLQFPVTQDPSFSFAITEHLRADKRITQSSNDQDALLTHSKTHYFQY